MNKLAILLFFALVFPANLLIAQESVTLSKTTPGPFQVGFSAFEEYDNARIFQPQHDYFGNPIEGERARPLQICYWYPATTGANDVPMTYAEYEYIYPEKEDFINHLARVHSKYSQTLMMFLGGSGPYMDFINQPTRAVKDAALADGEFPMILYFPNLETSYLDNYILCEYLASQGYIVASTHPVGLARTTTEVTHADLETLIRDIEFVYAQLKEKPFVDNEKLGCVGFGSGGMAALLFQMRNSDVDGTVTMGNSLTDTTYSDLITDNPFYNVKTCTAPIMQIYSTDTEPSFTITDNLKYCEIYSVNLKNSTPLNHCTGALLQKFAAGDTLVDLNYDFVINTTGMFFRDMFKEFEILLSLKDPKVSFIDLKILKAKELPPNFADFVQIIRMEGAPRAIEVYQQFEKEDPGSITLDIGMLNQVGYGLMQQGRSDDAVIIFRLNAETYPNIANCWDSFADGCLAAGDTEQARKCYEKVLEVLPNDDTVDDNFKTILKTNADNYLNPTEENN